MCLICLVESKALKEGIDQVHDPYETGAGKPRGPLG